MWGKSHRDGMPMALRVTWEWWVFGYFLDGLTIEFQSIEA